MHMLMGKKTQKLLNTLARNVKAAREELGYSQIKLAEVADLSRGHINEIEQGRKGITLESLQSLARALGVEPWMLLHPEAQNTTALADARFARNFARELHSDVTDTIAETARRLLTAHLRGESDTDTAQPEDHGRSISFRDAHSLPDPFADPESQASESPGESDEPEDAADGRAGGGSEGGD